MRAMLRMLIARGPGQLQLDMFDTDIEVPLLPTPLACVHNLFATHLLTCV